MLAVVLLVLSLSLSVFAKFPLNARPKGNVLPGDWHDFRVVKSGVSTSPNAYFMTSIWYGEGANTCSNSASTLYGFGFDSCISGVDADNQPIDNSLVYTFTSQDSQFVYYNIANYTSADCTGSYVNVTQQTPTACLYDGHEGWRWSYVPSSTPWEGMPAGIVNKDSQSADSCAKGDFNRFSYVKLKECYEVTGDAQSETFDGCGNGKFQFTFYSDKACATSTLHRAAPLNDCYYGNDGSSVYETMMCV